MASGQCRISRPLADGEGSAAPLASARPGRHPAEVMNGRALRYFLAVVRVGSVRGAAARLNVAASAISRQIMELETECGQPLLERSQAGVAPTLCGDALLRRAAEALDALDQGVREVDFLADPAAGEVRVGASEPYIAGGHLAAAIARASG